MYSLQKVKELEIRSNSYLKTMQAMVSRLASQIDEIRLDASHSEAYIEEEIANLRQERIPAIEEIQKIIRAVAEELEPQKRFWESTPLVLSKFHFTGGSENDLEQWAQDAQIRLSVLNELSALPEFLLKLHFESALLDRDWAMLFQCFLAGQKKGIVFENLGDIPDQMQSLLSIETAQLNDSEAAFLLRDAHGTRLTPERRLSDIDARDNIESRIRDIKNRIATARAASEKSEAA